MLTKHNIIIRGIINKIIPKLETYKFIDKIKPKSGEIILFKTKNSNVSRGGKFNSRFIYINEVAAKVTQ